MEKKSLDFIFFDNFRAFQPEVQQGVRGVQEHTKLQRVFRVRQQHPSAVQVPRRPCI